MHDILLVVAFMAIILAPALAARNVMTERTGGQQTVLAPQMLLNALSDMEFQQVPVASANVPRHDIIASPEISVADSRIMATEKRLANIERVLSTIAENQAAAAHDQSLREESEARQSSEFAGGDFLAQPRRTQPKLLRRWSVATREAAEDTFDPNPPDPNGRSRRRKIQPIRRIHEVTGAMAGDRSSGPMDPLRAHSQPQYQDASSPMAQPGDRPRRVVLVQVGATLRYVEVYDVDPQPLTSDDILLGSDEFTDEFAEDFPEDRYARPAAEERRRRYI